MASRAQKRFWLWYGDIFERLDQPGRYRKILDFPAWEPEPDETLGVLSRSEIFLALGDVYVRTHKTVPFVGCSHCGAQPGDLCRQRAGPFNKRSYTHLTTHAARRGEGARRWLRDNKDRLAVVKEGTG